MAFVFGNFERYFIMRNMRNIHNDGFFSSMPLFFKLWFGFIFTMVISIFIMVGYTMYSVASDPAATAREIGSLVGEMEKGYEDVNKGSK